MAPERLAAVPGGTRGNRVPADIQWHQLPGDSLEPAIDYVSEPPPFLIKILRDHLQRHDSELVFTADDGTCLWRSTFAQRILEPAVNGNEDRPRTSARTVPILPGLTFRGQRHSHKPGSAVKAHPPAPEPITRRLSGPVAS